jgi:hypothetical protein
MLGLGLDAVLLAIGADGPGVVPAQNLAPPAVTGTGAVGSALSGTIGIWNAQPNTSFAWAWQRNGADIAAASGTGTSILPYFVAAGDNGAALRLRVTATNGAGTAAAVSAPVTGFYLPPVATAGSWQIDVNAGQAMAPLPLHRGFTGEGLAFALAPGSAALPAGLSLSAAGLLAGTPAVAGTAALLVQASNSGGSATKAVTLTVNAATFSADYAAGVYSRDGAPQSFAGMHSFARAGEGQRLSPAGVYETVAANTPRFDFAPGGAALGLMAEPAGTNALLWSEELVTGWTLTGATRTPAGLSVRGRWGGVTVTSNGSTVHRIHQGVTVATGVPIGILVFFRYGTSGRLRLMLRNNATNEDSVVRGTPTTLTAPATAAGAITGLFQTLDSDNVAAIGCTITPNFTGDLRIGVGPDSSTAGETIIVLAVQTDIGSLIPTAGAAATRAADQVSLTGLTPGEADVRVTYDDASTSVAGAAAVTGSWWPPLVRRRVRRIEGFRMAYPPLRLNTGQPLHFENGGALAVETRA